MEPLTAYETFVGSISVKDFLGGRSIEESVKDLMQEKWWEHEDSGSPEPDNLASLISEYCELVLEKEAQFD